MNWSAQALRDASQRGDYGKVVKLVREAARVSQKQLGDALDLSQSAVSDWRNAELDSYDTTQLASVAAYLQIHPHLVGLGGADRGARREGGPSATASIPYASCGSRSVPRVSTLPCLRDFRGEREPATLRLATLVFRRMDGTAPSLGICSNLYSRACDSHRHSLRRPSTTITACVWLPSAVRRRALPGGCHGTWVTTVRRAPGTAFPSRLRAVPGTPCSRPTNSQWPRAVRGARRERCPSAEPHQKGPAGARRWVSGDRGRMPSNVEALADAAIGNASACDGALSAASRAAERVGTDAPPWPWMFTFNEAKVAANRVACGAHLGLPKWVSGVQSAADAALSSGHEKQRALLLLDVATGHMALGRLDGAFSLATRALETGLRYRSGRIVERARTLRRGYSSTTPPRVVRDFDERLSDAFL